MTPGSAREDLLNGSVVLETVDQDAPILVHIAVSFAARLLRDLGATVVRVSKDVGDTVCPIVDLLLRAQTEAATQQQPGATAQERRTDDGENDGGHGVVPDLS